MRKVFAGILITGFLLPGVIFGVNSAAPSDVGGALMPVWEARLDDFSDESYRVAVERLFVDFENRTGRKLEPGEQGKVGLKIYTDSGPGLATPPGLVRGVIHALESRGYPADAIFLVGLNQLRLRMTGFLPSLATGQSHVSGHPVFVLESGRFYDPVWYYDSPLPDRLGLSHTPGQVFSPIPEEGLEEDRKSFLATPLFLDADFWINLPVYTDHPVIGVNGALVNATLWNASNTARFFRSPANAPAAVAEMAAIPELRDSWVFTLVSLERYQYIGGPFFNSLYTGSAPQVWLSPDPVALDALMLGRLNQGRRSDGFAAINPDMRLLEFAEELGVGTRRDLDSRWIRIE